MFIKNKLGFWCLEEKWTNGKWMIMKNIKIHKIIWKKKHKSTCKLISKWEWHLLHQKKNNNIIDRDVYDKCLFLANGSIILWLFLRGSDDVVDGDNGNINDF